jgi:hypothetical protein
MARRSAKCLESVIAGLSPEDTRHRDFVAAIFEDFARQTNATHDAFDNRIVTSSPAVKRTSHRVSKTSWTLEGVGRMTLTRGRLYRLRI